MSKCCYQSYTLFKSKSILFKQKPPEMISEDYAIFQKDINWEKISSAGGVCY